MILGKNITSLVEMVGGSQVFPRVSDLSPEVRILYYSIVRELEAEFRDKISGSEGREIWMDSFLGMQVTHRSCDEFELFSWVIFGFPEDAGGIQKCVWIKMIGRQGECSAELGDVVKLRETRDVLMGSPFLAIDGLV